MEINAVNINLANNLATLKGWYNIWVSNAGANLLRNNYFNGFVFKAWKYFYKTELINTYYSI